MVDKTYNSGSIMLTAVTAPLIIPHPGSKFHKNEIPSVFCSDPPAVYRTGVGRPKEEAC